MRRIALLLLSASVLCACSGRLFGEDAEQKMAVVNVSLVFEKYDKVPDVQKRVDAKYKDRKDELQRRADDLAKRNKELEQFYSQQNSTEAVFDAIQKLRKDQFYFERDLTRLNSDIQDDFTREMRAVLTDIRATVRAVAEQEHFTLVLRSPDTDDPELAKIDPNAPISPADAEKNTYLQLNAPQSTMEVLERFNRNPVLFGAKTVDLTQTVLKKLNEDYAKRSTGVGQK